MGSRLRKQLPDERMMDGSIDEISNLFINEANVIIYRKKFGLEIKLNSLTVGKS